MDKDDFLKILESTSSHNINNFVYDREWSLFSGLSYIQDKPKENTGMNCANPTDNQPEDENKINKKEQNILNLLE